MYTTKNMDIKERISLKLKGILAEMEIVVDDINLEIPKDSKHGDLTTNISMRISKELNSNPLDIAKKIVSEFPKDEDISNVEAVSPGFINFFFSDKYLLNILNQIITDSKYFELDALSGKRYVIEYSDPNPFKIFHIGHLYTNMVGESFARLVEALGGSVVRANYQGDVGLHVAKSLWGLQKMLESDGLKFDDLKGRELVDRVRYLGDAYMLGFKMYDDEKDLEAIAQIKELNYYIFSLYIPSLEKKSYFSEYERIGIEEMYLLGKEWCLEYFNNIFERTYTKFDKSYLESQVCENGLDIVAENMVGRGKGIFEKNEGAVIYEGDKERGLHTRVFVNSEGLPTYEAKDLALALMKFEELQFDESVIITANEQSPYFKVVLDVLSQLSPGIAKRSKHFSHGMVKLPGAEKMSSRKGKIIEGEWLLDETKKKVEEVMKRSGKWKGEDIEKISEDISVGAIKYLFVKVSLGKDVIFNFDSAVNFDGDSGPYLQYVYARCTSLLGDTKPVFPTDIFSEIDDYTKELLAHISKYREVLLTSGLVYAPSILSSYLFDLGKIFNSFYQNVRVLDSENTEMLLTVVYATSIVMKHGLNVLGIKVVDKM